MANRLIPEKSNKLDFQKFAKSLRTFQNGLRAHLPTCQKLINFSFLRTNVPINVPTCQRAKGVAIFQLGVPMCQKRAILQLCMPKGRPIFQLFFKRIIFFIYLTYFIYFVYFRYIRNIYLLFEYIFLFA